MKILILCNSAMGLHSFRGLLIETLKNRGDTVVAVVPSTSDAHELFSEQELISLDCNLIHIDMDRRGTNPVRDCKLFADFFGIIRREKPDFVITYTIKPNIYGGVACRLAGITYAVNITGLGTAFENNGVVKKIVCALYKFSLKKAKVVFFENSGNREKIVNLGLVKKEKTKVLAGAGVDLDKFPFVKFPAESEETRFLFVGRVMKEKGIDELLCVMKRLQDNGSRCTLDIVGWLEEDYAALIKQYEKEGWLRYHGVQNDVRPFIENCHCFVLPSWHEGMANTNLESAASGRPVITSNIYGCLEAVIDGVTGFLCEKKNVDDLYDKLNMFCKLDYKSRVTMGIEGRKHMERKFDKKIIVAETIENLNF